MKALVYHGPGQKAWEDVPDAAIREPTDVVGGSIPPRSAAPTCTFSKEMWPPSPMAHSRHEAVGTVTEVGDAVKGFSAVTGCSSGHHQMRAL